MASADLTVIAGFRKRKHELWFCDAQTAGEYCWFETAFTPAPSQYPAPIGLPHALLPDPDRLSDVIPKPKTARSTRSADDRVRVAWPFTALNGADLDEFIGRWASWLAAAAAGRIDPPTPPDRPIEGSWRIPGRRRA
ncbi:hypothetical protein ACU686_12275 [Yinghuangia aomiensis]